MKCCNTKCGTTLPLIHCWWGECKLVQQLWKIFGSILENYWVVEHMLNLHISMIHVCSSICQLSIDLSMYLLSTFKTLSSYQYLQFQANTVGFFLAFQHSIFSLWKLLQQQVTWHQLSSTLLLIC